MRNSSSGSRNWHLKVGGKSPGEEVGLLCPGQRMEHLGTRAEALAGREGVGVGWGAQEGAPPRSSELQRKTTFKSENRELGAPASLKSTIQHKAILGMEAGLPFRVWGPLDERCFLGRGDGKHSTQSPAPASLEGPGRQIHF